MAKKGSNVTISKVTRPYPKAVQRLATDISKLMRSEPIDLNSDNWNAPYQAICDRIKSDPLLAGLQVDEVVWHWLADTDVRAKSPEYSDVQNGELARVLNAWRDADDGRWKSKNLFDRIASATRKRWLGSRQIYNKYRAATEPELAELEANNRFRYPDDLRYWLLTYGFGDFDDEIALRAEWTSAIERGALQGHVRFAQDQLGNFYSLDPESDAVHYICRSAPEFAFVAENFTTFLAELEKRDFKIDEWMDELPVRPYDWS